MNVVATDCSFCLDPLDREPEQNNTGKKNFFSFWSLSREKQVSGLANLQPCKHQFHAKCIYEWVISKRTCPTCLAFVQETDFPLPKPKNINSLLLDAVESGDLAKVTHLLDMGADVTAGQTRSSTPLNCALKNNDFDIAELLISRSPTVDAEAFEQLAMRYLHNHPDALNKRGRAVELLKIAAQHGLIQAKRNLGVMYCYGIGLPADQQTGVHYLQMASKQGDTEAQLYLGIMYFFGEGTRQDYLEAFQWFEESSKKENAHAQQFLGRLYYGGLGVSKDFDLAKKWYKKAAMNGSIEAMVNLGNMYTNGSIMKKNAFKALSWMEKAHERAPENPYVLFSLGQLYMQEYNKPDIGQGYLRKADELCDGNASECLQSFYNDVNDYAPIIP